MTPTPDDGTVLVTFVDVSKAITFGADEQGALMQAIDAVETGLSFYVDARQPLPEPTKAKRGQKTVSLSALECAKLGVRKAMTAQGMRKAELARRLGWHVPQVDRLFDLRHASEFEQLETAAAVLGKLLGLSLELGVSPAGFFLRCSAEPEVVPLELDRLRVGWNLTPFVPISDSDCVP